VTYIVERLAELRRHLDHLRTIRPRVAGPDSLTRDSRFPDALVRRLERLPGFRNVVIHGYVMLDMQRVIDALDDLAPIEQFAEIVRGLAAHAEPGGR
jgi:hypothetical protein